MTEPALPHLGRFGHGLLLMRHGTSPRSSSLCEGDDGCWLEARDRATNEPLLGRPRHSGRAALTYTTPIGLRLNVSGR